jgi:nucleotide-binding universal stress UspA family protein
MTYLDKRAADLRSGLFAPLARKQEADLNLAVTWSVAVDADVAAALIRVAEQGRADAGTCMVGGCDLLAMATHGRSGLPRWMIGSITERILGATKLPLLIVHPPQGQPASAASELVEVQIA